MKHLPAFICITLAGLFLVANAKVWSGAGHQVIAAEAYRQLSPTFKTKVAEILKAHPDYEKWKESSRKSTRAKTLKDWNIRHFEDLYGII
jgi:hypothetical protein